MIDVVVIDLIAAKNHVLASNSFQKEIMYALQAIEAALNMPNPRFYALKRLPSTMSISARNMQLPCPQVAQIGLYVRHLSTGGTITPKKYAGMEEWDALGRPLQRLVAIARDDTAAIAPSEVVNNWT